MIFALLSSAIFYALLAAIGLDYLTEAAFCGCWPPAPEDLYHRIAGYYLLSIIAALILVWRDNE